MTAQPNSGTQRVVGHKSFQQYIPSNSSAWDGLAKWLPTRDENSSWWWKSTGRQLATILADGGYELSQQYEALLFHYRMVVPWLGARPTSVKPKWKSFMTDDFSPIEYSWKWAKDCKAPEVRYGVEPLSLHAGSALDPLNQMPTRALLQQVRQVMPDDIDLTWFDHFLRSIFGGETTSPVPGQGTQNRSSLFLAFEMVRNRIAVKAYFIPVELPGGPSAAEQIAVAIQSAPEMNNMRAYDAIQMMEFVSSGRPGRRDADTIHAGHRLRQPGRVTPQGVRALSTHLVRVCAQCYDAGWQTWCPRRVRRRCGAVP